MPAQKGGGANRDRQADWPCLGDYLEGMLYCLACANPGGLSDQRGLSQARFNVAGGYPCGVACRVNAHCQQRQSCHLQEDERMPSVPLVCQGEKLDLEVSSVHFTVWLQDALTVTVTLSQSVTKA